MWDLIVSVPDHCLSFYFPTSLLFWGTFVLSCQFSKGAKWPGGLMSVHPILAF